VGVLGAARIAPLAIVRPARRIPGVTVSAIAARDPQRARAFADKHGVARVHATYADLIDDPDIDAVYIPLPNALHAEWTLRAIAAGKHVLCEKPFTANAAEAHEVADAADASDVVVMEAFHYRYHSLAQRMHALVAGGALGEIRSVRTSLCFPLPKFSDIRYDYAPGARVAVARPGRAEGGVGDRQGARSQHRSDRPGDERAVRVRRRCDRTHRSVDVVTSRSEHPRRSPWHPRQIACVQLRRAADLQPAPGHDRRSHDARAGSW
jgi:hypothetical protein